ncbi:MAG: glycyl-radical enzyme activating protein [Coprothermobacterota bacterium]|nr:glycyl-radical enzyme activating protein [Coprothermobacterota bacterium]
MEKEIFQIEKEGNRGKISTVKGIIFNIQRYSIQDGPGIRTTVFLKGCPLRCLWCHNPEGINPKPEIIWWERRCLGCRECVKTCPLSTDIFPPVFDPACNFCGKCLEVCPAKALEFAGKEFTVPELMEEILKDRIFFDVSHGGVTFSGGEPLFQSPFLLEMLKACKEERVHTTVDTSGYAPEGLFQEVAGLTDLFLYDLKIMDEKRHRSSTGVSNSLILENLSWLAKGKRKVIVRFPVIPGINDDDLNIQLMGEFLLSLKIEEIDLIPYHKIAQDKYRRLRREYQLSSLEPPDQGRLEKIKMTLENFIPLVKIGG